MILKNYASIVGFGGVVLVIFGLLLYSVNSVITMASWILLILGLILLVGFVILRFKEIRQGLSSRSTKFGANAAFMTIFVLGILIILNILFARFNWRLDTTAAKQFSLAEQTRKVLQNLDQDLKVLGFYKTDEVALAEELLTEYKQYSTRFGFELYDPDKKPGIAKRYEVQQYGTLIVESNGKQERLTELTEEKLTNAIIKVSRDGVKKIYFTTGHGEKDPDDGAQNGISSAKDIIAQENYQVEKILLAEQDSIPSDCSVLVIAGPQSDLFENEVQMISAYLDQGGKLFLLIDPSAPDGYIDFAAKWGVKVGRDVVVDASGIGQLFGAGPMIPIVSQYESHAIVKDFSVMTFFPETRSITKSSEVPSGVTVFEVAKTSPRSWGETSSIATGQIKFDDGVDLKGPVSILTVAEKTATHAKPKVDKFDLGATSVKTRLVFVGDSDFSTNAYFRVQGNKDLFMNAISWLAEEEDLISVRPKDPEDRRLNLTQKQSRIMLYVGVFLLPLAIFAAGVVVYKKRR